MSNWTIAVSFAVFIVWEQRHIRWANFAKALAGTYTVAGSPNAGTSVTGGKATTTTKTAPPTATKTGSTTPNAIKGGKPAQTSEKKGGGLSLKTIGKGFDDLGRDFKGLF